ncbi:MAG: methyltransferase domain-containing protein [Planctomycetota bacterium]
MNEAEFRRWNEEMVARFPSVDYYEHSHPVVRWIEGRRLAFLAREVDRLAPASVLEVGCGACHVLARMKAKLRVGTDISPAMLSASAERTAGQSIRLVQADARKLPFADGCFDAVVCTEVLEHVPDPAGIVDEVHRVLRPRGIAIFTVPCEGMIDAVKKVLAFLGLDRRLFSNVAELRAKGWHLHVFTLGSFVKLLAGRFRIRSIRRLPFVPLVLRYAAVCVSREGGTGGSSP